MRNTKQTYDEDVERILAQKEKLRRDLEDAHQQGVSILLLEKDELLAKHDVEKEELINNLNMLAADRDALLISAENEKQQVSRLDKSPAIRSKIFKSLKSTRYLPCHNKRKTV